MVIVMVKETLSKDISDLFTRLNEMTPDEINNIRKKQPVETGSKLYCINNGKTQSTEIVKSNDYLITASEMIARCNIKHVVDNF